MGAPKDDYESDAEGNPKCPNCGETLPCPPGGMEEGFAGLDEALIKAKLEAAKKSSEAKPKKKKRSVKAT